MSDTADHPIFVIAAFTAGGLYDRTFGFYHTEVEARAAVEVDNGGMHELRYTYLVIEKVWPGVHGESEVIDWFQWTERGPGHGGDAPWQWCEAPYWAVGLTALGGVG